MRDAKDPASDVAAHTSPGYHTCERDSTPPPPPPPPYAYVQL